MKTIQRLEIFAGLAVLVTASLSFYFIHLPQMEDLKRLGNPSQEFLTGNFLLLLLPALLILFGVCAHAIKRSIIGLLIILVFGGLTVFLHAVGFLVGQTFNGHKFLGVLSGLFAMTTVFLALYSHSLPSTNQTKSRSRALTSIQLLNLFRLHL